MPFSSVDGQLIIHMGQLSHNMGGNNIDIYTREITMIGQSVLYKVYIVVMLSSGKEHTQATLAGSSQNRSTLVNASLISSFKKIRQRESQTILVRQTFYSVMLLTFNVPFELCFL